ncbi:MAG: 23S rRNA (pseudouridine(1915)-N(3))-methyltransferase RlmH [Patescibacteria group bacterium]|nr:23S rRNA (pseudouridine(1915)-N(3))-methyltransferase RlmH [Patescibacteria group bacterium]
MLDIEIIAIGKMKTSYWNEAACEYLKRLKPFASIKIKELKFTPFTQNNFKRVIAEEEARITEAIARSQGQVFLLTEQGKKLDSLGFAQILDKLDSQKIIFVIAGSLGFSSAMKKKYKSLSLSEFTFTHEMARVIILEQIYRAVTIVNNKNYHY